MIGVFTKLFRPVFVNGPFDTKTIVINNGILAFLNDSLTPHKILTLIIKFPARAEISQVSGAQCDTNVIQSMRCADEIYFTTWEYLLV